MLDWGRIQVMSEYDDKVKCIDNSQDELSPEGLDNGRREGVEREESNELK